MGGGGGGGLRRREFAGRAGFLLRGAPRGEPAPPGHRSIPGGLGGRTLLLDLRRNPLFSPGAGAKHACTMVREKVQTLHFLAAEEHRVATRLHQGIGREEATREAGHPDSQAADEGAAPTTAIRVANRDVIRRKEAQVFRNGLGDHSVRRPTVRFRNHPKRRSLPCANFAFVGQVPQLDQLLDALGHLRPTFHWTSMIVRRSAARVHTRTVGSERFSLPRMPPLRPPSRDASTSPRNPGFRVSDAIGARRGQCRDIERPPPRGG